VNFILLAHWNGRFGNRMHQYAYGATYSKINSVKFILPSDWEGTKLFKNQIHEVCDNKEARLHINQSKKPFDSIERTNDYMEIEADVLHQVLEENKIEKAILFGHSDGGCVKGDLAFCQHGQRVLAGSAVDVVQCVKRGVVNQQATCVSGLHVESVESVVASITDQDVQTSSEHEMLYILSD
jgi:hypothetical protein